MSHESEEFVPTTKNERDLLTAKAILQITNESELITDKCRNFNKHNNNSTFGDITGEKLIVPLNNIAVIDIDFNKKLDEIFGENDADDIREEIKQKIDHLNACLNIMISRTTSGGFHIYCDGSEIRNNPNFDDKSSVHTHAFKHEIECEDMKGNKCKEVIFDIDLFVPTKNGRKCGVMLPGSLAINKKNNYGCYEFISLPNERTKKLSSIFDVFEELDIVFDLGDINSIWKEEESISPPISKKTDDRITNGNSENHVDITKELLSKIINGFKGFAISSRDINIIVRELKSCTNEVITENECKIYAMCIANNCILDKDIDIEIDILLALIYWESMSKIPRCDTMIEILKERNNTYYINEIVTLINPGKIDLHDDFSIANIAEKNYVVKGILNKKMLYNDIKRVYVDIENQDRYFIKIYDGIMNKYVLDVVNLSGLKARFDKIKIYDKSGNSTIKKLSLSDIILNSGDSNVFMKKGVKFYSNDKDIFSLFQGFNFKESDYVDVDKIAIFLKHVKEIIASGDENIYKYIISWVAYLIQNPGKKTKTCLILIGKHGVGKTIFTDIISKLFGEYAHPNISDVDLIAGKFNTELENKILIVLNEFNIRDKMVDKISIRNKMKTYITDELVTINRKNVNPYKVENVSNFIIVTNDKNPIWIEEGDRRYVAIDVSDKMKDNVDYFNELFDSLTDEFYKNLFNYFRLCDIKDFNPRVIPNTERKSHIIDSNKDSFEYYMDENRDKFYPCGKFTSKATAYESYKIFCESEKITHVYDGMKFRELLNERCVLKSQRERSGDGPRKFYVLKDEFIDN